MDHAQLNTLTDVHVLRALVADQLQIIARHERTITERDANIAKLNAEITRLRRVQFAARSEKMDPAQRQLFEETMAADIAAVEAELEALQSPPATEPSRPRRSPIRRALPEDLERVETRHEPASCECGQCGGALTHIDDHVSEKLSCRPLTFFVRRDVYPQYACRSCETITAVPVPSPRRICWRMSSWPSMSITCRCIGRKPSTPAAAWPSHAQPRASGSVRAAWPCSRW